MMSYCFIVVVAAAFSPLQVAEAKLEDSHRSTVMLVDHGYEGILIAIGESVPETDSTLILSRIEQYFTEASETLYRATNNRVYFRNITVLLPNCWKNDSHEAATSETFAKANFVIDGPGLNTPTTWTYGNCGEPGEFIQIPIGFMTADRNQVVRIIGKPGRTLVHEWGHLRWGLRDEYPVVGQERFYRDSNNQVAAVKCGKHMKGKAVDDVTGGICTLDPATGLPTTTCRFVADDASGVIASLMFYHNLTEVTTFCDKDENTLETLHNDEAPSQQNIVCDGRSAWEVMRKHEDFLGGNNPTLAEQQSPVPQFRYVRAQNKRIVMVLDVSGSMVYNQTAGLTRLDKLRHASAEFLFTVVQEGMFVGIVNFSTVATTLVNLTEVTSTTVKQILVDKLPNDAQGITAIGLGLLEGLKLLEHAGDPRGGVLILVSDGKENRNPRMADVKPTLLEKGVVLHMILISDAADKNMIELSAATGGKAFFDSGTPYSTDLQSALRTIVSDEDVSAPGVAPVQLLQEAMTIEPKGVVNRSVNIDSSVGRETKFSLSYTGNDFTLNVTVTSPSGAVYCADEPRSHNSVATNAVTIAIQNETEVGLWTITVRNPGQLTTVTNVLVTSKSPSDDIYPIRARTFINQHSIDFDDSSTTRLVVRAQVKKGYTPIIGAKVEVQVGSLPWKPMKDDGLGIDVVKDDGYYSALLFNFTCNGYFPVKVRTTAKGGNETRLLTRGGSRAFQLYPSDEKTKDLGTMEETVDPFDRKADAGLISVNNVKSPAEMKNLYPYPPAKVKDLKVIEMSYENVTVTLKWTAVGDYDEQETASSYDIRISSDIKQLRHSFENATQIKSSDIHVGNKFAPLAATETEVYVIHVPSPYNNKTLFFSLKVNHSSNRTSDVSNIVSAAIVYVPPKLPSTSPRGPDYTAEGDTTIDYTTTMDQTTEQEDTTMIPTTTVALTTGPDYTISTAAIKEKRTTQSADTNTNVILTTAHKTDPDTITNVATAKQTHSQESSNGEHDSTSSASTTLIVPTEKDKNEVTTSITGASTTKPTPTRYNSKDASTSVNSNSTTNTPPTQKHIHGASASTSSATTINTNHTREYTKEVPASTTSTTSNSTTTWEQINDVPANNIADTQTNRSSTNEASFTTSATTTIEQAPDLSQNSASSQFAWKLALGTSLLVLFLIACPLIIKTIRSQKARRSNGLWENWGREHNLHRGAVVSWDGRLPYSSPADNVCNVGHRSVGNVKPCYLPRVSQYQPRRQTHESGEA